MREILFRAKLIDNGEWIEGYLILIDGKAAICQCGLDWEESSGLVGGDWYFVDSTSIGQFTGLYDKNGKRIFEGDVVEMHQFLFDGNEYEHETKGAIKWGEYGWLLSQIEGEAVNKYMGYKNGEGETYFINFYGLHEESFEVIGTIHDEVSP